MEFPIPIEKIVKYSFPHLIENKLALKEDYIGKVRLVLREISKSIKNGWIENVTDQNKVKSDINQGKHFFYTYNVPDEYNSKIMVSLELRKFDNDKGEITTHRLFDLSKILLGRPCGLLIFETENGYEASIPISIIVNMEILHDDIFFKNHSSS